MPYEDAMPGTRRLGPLSPDDLAGSSELAREARWGRWERRQRLRLERYLREEIAQELSGIALMVAAVRRLPEDATGPRNEALERVAALLALAIGHCAPPGR